MSSPFANMVCQVGMKDREAMYWSSKLLLKTTRPPSEPAMTVHRAARIQQRKSESNRERTHARAENRPANGNMRSMVRRL